MQSSEFIESSINKIFEDFQKEVDQAINLCDLQYSRFDIPDSFPKYGTNYVRQHYLLRYFPIYFIEYEYIYSGILNSNFINPSELNILSVGAGCGLDFYGLQGAVKDSDKYGYFINNYFGIDKIDWSYKDLLEKVTPNIIVDNITNLNNIEKNNILMFPKSIGEFNKQEFEKLKEIIRTTEFSSEKLILISSARPSKKLLNYDYQRFQDLSDVIEKKGYRKLDNFETKSYYPDSHLFNLGFKYPDHIVNYLKDLEKFCKHNKKIKCANECHPVIERNSNPIFSTQYIKYHLMRFEKV